MATVYHTSVTANVTFDPYLSPIGRVRDVLRCIASETGSNDIKITNRELAELAQCSAGSIPGILRTLEADGHIERIATRQGSLVYLCSPSPARSAAEPVAPTRSAADRPLEHDQHADQERAPIPQQSQGSEFDRPQKHDQKLIPPCTPHKVLDSCMQQQQLRAAAFARQNAEIRDRLRQFPLFGRDMDKALAEHGYTLGEIEAKIAALRSRSDVRDPARFLYAALISGEPVYSAAEIAAREQQHASANQRAGGTGAHQPKRPGGAGGGRGRAEQRAAKPAKPTIDYEAWARENLELPVRGA